MGTVPRVRGVGQLAVRIHRAATEQVDAASVAVFRIAFGVAMVVNTALYVPVLVREYYLEPEVSFPYGSLTFITPPPAPVLYVVYAGMAGCGVLIALGRWYRPAAGAFFLLHTYVFLLDSTYFQNHEYLISLLALLLVLLPLDRYWSLDARARPALRSATVPRGVVWLLRFQIGIPYVYGGIAKLNGDWLRGEPLRMWVGDRTDVEPLSTILDNGTVVWLMAYGSLVLDLVVVGLLLHHRTRLPAFVVVTCFHVMNAWLFGLFIFPWLMIAATTIFFPPDWPVRLRRWAGATVPARPARSSWPAPASGLRRGAVLAGCGIWVLVQLIVPLRHHVIDGDPSWTEQGHRFAWHMKLRSKQGTVTFVVSKDGRTWTVDPSPHLGSMQAARLAGHPERLVHFARYLAEQYGGAEVRAETSVSLNGRRPQPIVDPQLDLTTVTPRWRDTSWILPLEEPLRPSS